MRLKDITGNEIEVDCDNVDEFTITGVADPHDEANAGRPISAVKHFSAEVSIMDAVYLFEGDEAIRLWQGVACQPGGVVETQGVSRP